MTEAVQLVSMRSIVKHFGDFVAIHDASLAIRPGEIHALVGENGAGKSTLMKILYGLLPRTAGEVLMIRTHKWSNRWGIPGGKIKTNEPALDALRREVREETGLELRDIRFALVQDCIEPPEFYKRAHFLLLNYTAGATTTVSTARTMPIATASANNGAPDNIDIAAGGSITLNSPSPATSPAVVINSNNTATNEGSINFKDVDNAIGVLLTGGNTGSFTNTGAIAITESTAASDTNSDGVVEAPFAKGGGVGKERYGVLVQGSSPFVGNIVNGAGGTITVTGNNSFGISAQSALTGNITNVGTIAVLGNNTVGISETGGVSGNVLVTGGVTATGQGAQGVVLAGDVAGRFSVYSTISATGYGSTARNATNTIQTTIQATASEVQQGGPAVAITGNIGGGVYIGAQPANTLATSTADVDGDGISDGGEGEGILSSYGSSPALLIGAAGKDVHLGALQFTATPANPYGLIIAGAVSSSGIEDGVSATALQIGVDPALPGGGGTVHIDGGVDISGSISAIAYGANATAVQINSGTTAPALVVSGTVNTLTSNPVPNATTGLPTPYNGAATGILIASGASVSSLNVTGTIVSTADGDTANAVAVRDLSGSLSSVDVTGRIAAVIVPNSTTTGNVTTTDIPSGTLTALDLAANTTGVTLNLHQPAEVITTASTTNGVTTTTVTAGPVVQNATGAAISTSTTTNGVTTTTTIPVAPSIVGNVNLGTGPNTVNLLAGTISGGLNLGSAASSVTIDNGASYAGLFSYGGTGLSLHVTNGAFTTTNPVTLTGTSLNVGASGVLIFAVDPANNRATNFIINGTANLSSGAKLGVDILSTLTGPQTYQLIKASTLTVGGADATLVPDVPYLFAAAVTSNTTAGTVSLIIRPKTASEIGLGTSEGAALPAVYAALPSDPTVQSAVFSQYTQAGFLSLYRQFLPEYTGGLERAASEAARTISRLTGEPNDIGNPTGTRGLWAQQFFVGVDKERDETAGFRAGGFGYVAGVETGGLGFGAVGGTISFTAINLGDQSLPGDNRTGLSQLEGGVYWQGEAKGLLLDARAAAGYDWFTGRRQLVQIGSTGLITLNRQTKESWTGYSLTGHFGAGYDIPLSATYYVRPHVQLDYFRLDEGAYAEKFGGPAFNLNVADRTSDEGSGTASVIFGAKYGTGFVWRPQLEVGVRDIFAGGIGSTTAHYTGGQSFTISPEDISGAAALLRAKIKASGEYYEVGFEAGGEAKGNYYEGDVKLSVRVLF